MTKARDLANSAAAFASVSATELGYVDGVTSAIQTQMDAKAPSSTAVTLTGTQTLTNKTLTSPVIASVINNTLTSTTGDIIYASAANTPARLGIGSTSNVLTVSGGVPAWVAPAGGGKVLQVVQGTLTGTFSTTSSSYVDTGLTVSITPSSASSKVYVTYSGGTAATITGSATNNYGLLRLMADATQVQGLNVGYYALASSTNPEAYIPTALSLLHSPATTSAVTYKIQIRVAAATNFKIFASGVETASIVAMEIGA